MQTKKKISARNIRDNVCPRAARLQKKASQNFPNAEKKVTELIMSSPRKLRFARIPPKLSKDSMSSNKMNRTCVLAQDEMQDICLEYSADSRTCVDHKEARDDVTPQRMLETIFSPGFHISKDVGGSMTNSAEFIEFFRNENEQVLHHRVIDGLELDASMGLIVQKGAFSAEYKEQNTSSHSRAAGPTTFSSHMDVDSEISPDRSDVQEFCNQKPPSDTNVASSHLDEGFSGADLSPEVSAIYLAMQHSKLECVDEPSQDCSSNQVYDEQTNDCEEFDYFDPYLFIKNLPDLSSVVPTFRPLLLPKQTRSCPSTTLVLDLDETLVHSTLEPCSDADFTFPVNFNLMKHTVYVRCRPYLKDFMEKIASLFEIIIFTASQSIYAEQLLNVLDPKRRVFRHRVYRDSCVLVDGNYLKDLSVLGRDLAHVIIIDNSPQAFGFQVDNGIPIESWFDDRTDQELLLLLPFLESLVGVDDVRPLIARKFNIREKVARANFPCAKL